MATRCREGHLAQRPLNIPNGRGQLDTSDRTTPHEAKVEKAVLGAMLIGSTETIDRLRSDDGLVPEDFYNSNHRRLCVAIFSIHDRGGLVLARMGGPCSQDRPSTDRRFPPPAPQEQDR